MTATPAAPDGSDLCTACGICCDGTLFSAAPVGEGEEIPLISAGLDLFDGKKARMFRLPCAKLDGACCTIYDTRPHVCRAFACKLLRGYQDGEVGFADAIGTIAEAHRLSGQIRALAPEAANHRARRDMLRGNRWREIADPAERARSARLSLEIEALENFLDRKFRRPPTTGKRQDI